MGTGVRGRDVKRANNVVAVGLVSFFGGISQDLILPILPLYLTSVVGLDKAVLGVAEGLVTASASVFRIVSGLLTDKFRRRKPIVFVGYFLSLVSRPLLAIATSGGAVIGLRFVDGVGKGVKDAPKDALLADSTVQATRGRGFGIARALDTLGSVAGPLALFGLLNLLATNSHKYQWIFLLSSIPLVLSLAVLVLRVREPEAPTDLVAVTASRRSLPRAFYGFLAIMLIFSLGNSTDAFLILRAQTAGVTVLAIPLVYALFNFVYAGASIPLGSLSDRIGRERVILLGWVAYALAYLGFAVATRSYQIWILFAFYGLYYATTEGVAKAFVADLVASEHRGKAYGIYNAAIGVMALPASLIAGLLWDTRGPAAPFFFGSVLAALAAIGLALFVGARTH